MQVIQFYVEKEQLKKMERNSLGLRMMPLRQARQKVAAWRNKLMLKMIKIRI